MKRLKSRRNVVIGSSGRQKRRNVVGSVDRISGLPDSILGIILSFLDTRRAVSTALLSKRWKLAWTMVHKLDFYCENYWGLGTDDEHDTRFAGFVNRVLSHHDNGWLEKFHLFWINRCISSHATSWISFAISKNVHNLSLVLVTRDDSCDFSDYYTYFSDYYTVVLPTSVFSCDALRILWLHGNIIVPELIAVCLPRLEKITLVSIYFQSEKAFDKLIRGCPVLINLCISIDVFMLIEFHSVNDFAYRIASTSLRRLEVDIYYPDGPDVPMYLRMELEAPSLEYLSLDGFIPALIVKKSLRSLVEVKLNAELGEDNFSDVHACNSVVEAVRVFDCAKALVLSDHTIRALNCATISLSTEFKRLVNLEATTYTCACSSIRDFIECSHNLEVLMVYEINSVLDEIEHDSSNWTAPVQVPRCLSNSLKKVVIKGYEGVEDDGEMIRYILKHGKSLEDVEISFSHCLSDREHAKLELVREICEFSKKLSSEHPACEVKFVGETSKCNFKVV